MSFKRAASATIVIAKTKDRSIELMAMGSGLRWQLSEDDRSGKTKQSSYPHSYCRYSNR
jgi:hypothetical protein